MDYNKKTVIEAIVKNQLEQIPRTVLEKFNHKTIKDENERIIHNTKLFQELDSLELDLEVGILTNEDLKELTGVNLELDQILDLCQDLKSLNFSWEYVSYSGYTIEFFNYFNSVSVSISRMGLTIIKLFTSDKILLKDNV
jgi:hypothetical protein